MKKRLVTMAALFSLSISALAQDTTLQLNDNVITESRYEVSDNQVLKNITVITAKEIEASPAKNIQELLEYVAGVDVRPRGPQGVQADVSIRGGSFEQTLILINGVKVIDPQTGHHALNLPISINDIERIEIQKGSGARVFGQNAFNGVINIITKKPGGNSGHFSTTRGDYGLGLYSLSSNASSDSYFQRFSFSYGNSDGYIPNSDYAQGNALYQSYFMLGKHTQIDILGGAQFKNFGANTYYSDFFKNQYEETDVYFGNLTLTNKNLANLKVNLYHRRHEDIFMLKKENPSFYRNKHISRVTGIDASSSIKSNLGITAFGVEGRIELIESNNLGNHDRIITSFFVEQRYTKGKFELTPGFNLTSISNYDPVLYPGMNVAYHANEKLTFSVGSERSFRVPSYTELYYEDPSNSGDSTLKPEEALTHEFNLKYREKYYLIQSSFYYRQGTNLIDWQRPSDTVQWQVGNVTELNTYGAELSGTFFINKLFPKNPIEMLNVRYNYQTSERADADEKSRYVFDYLQHQAIVGVTYKIVGNLKHTATVRNEQRVGYNSRWLLDTKLYWEAKDYTIFVEGTNVTDVNYKEISTVIMPGRWVRGGFTYNF